MDRRQAELIDRLRAMLGTEASTREVAMFGGRAFMVDDRLLVCATKDGGLLVRAAAERHERLVREPGATQAEMGTGRSMGPGWISVSAEAVAEDRRLRSWLDVALEHHREGMPSA